MNINKNLNGGIAMCVAISSLFVSCAKFETREFTIDKPQTIIDQEALDANNEIKSYINYSNQPNFKLGAELSLTDVASNTVLYRLMQDHFDEIGFTRLTHLDYVLADGNPNVVNISAALETNESASTSIHAGHLVQHSNQRAAYLNTLIPDLIIPGESGTVMVADFESETVGNTYPYTYLDLAVGAGTVVVSTDPIAGPTNSGKTVYLNGNRVVPQIQVNLPVGVTLGDCKKLLLDINLNAGRYGGGIQLGVSSTFGYVPTKQFNPGKNWDAVGAPQDQWNRKAELDLTTYPFTDAEKALTSFVLTVGNTTGEAKLHMDNIRLEWSKIGQVIPKSPAERKEIYTAELDKWIKAMGETGKGRINSWSVVYQPMDETDPSQLRTKPSTGTIPANTFYWQDYLGKDYAAIAIGMLKQYANASDKIFFTETNLVDNPAKIQGLKDFITYTEGKGAQVDGIATELALNLDADKAKIETMLQSLAATGKLIKISALDIGTGTTTAQATPILYQQQSDMYKWFVKAYNDLIPANQRGGITFRSPHDRISGDSWRANEPVGLWTRFTTGSTVKAGFQRKPAYLGVIEAFQGK
jgi:endo-1,4-beta-xylanase